MKNISFPLVILLLLIVSCTTDTIHMIDSIENKVNNKNSEKSARLVQDLTPKNPANIYDFAGKLHNDILDVYLAGNYQYTTLEQISQQIESIVAANNDLMLLDVGTNVSIDLIIIQEIANNPQVKLDQAISNSTMTSAAKESLSIFMNDMPLWKNHSYQEIYESIISYESAVIVNPAFNNEDKRIILTTSSIVRYSIYYDLMHEDKDWDSSKGNRIGGLSGAMDNSSTAIRCSLITGIMIHTLVIN